MINVNYLKIKRILVLDFDKLSFFIQINSKLKNLYLFLINIIFPKLYLTN